MLKKIHQQKKLQLGLGLLAGICFGFFLQKGRVTHYDVILGQLLLEDFTVVKVILSAVITGMIGIHILTGMRLAELHPKKGSLATAVVGGLIFGIGFAVLGYCPGTIAGAIGNGHLDALIGGLAGIILGAGLFASVFARLQKPVLSIGDLGDKTIPQVLGVNPWFVVIPATVILAGILWILEKKGL